MLNITEMTLLRDAKVTDYNDAYRYYDSEKRPVYLTDRLHDFFAKNPHYTQNWCSLVVDAVRNKLRVDGFSIGEDDDPRQETFNAFWDENEMNIEADTVHEYAHIIGEAFIVAGWDTKGKILAHAHDPRAVVVDYGGDNPREITQAALFWMDGKTHKATSWTLQEGGKVIEETFTGGQQRVLITSGMDAEEIANEAKKATGIHYVPDGAPIVTDYPRIPVFHFRRSSRNIESEFYQVKSIQDSINKTFVLLGFSTENASDAVRWAITNANLQTAKRAQPGDIINIPPASDYEQPVSIGAFGSADLQKFGELLIQWKQDIASITQTPMHYFGDQTGANISGEALQALEAPLVDKVNRYIRRYSPTWEALAAFVLSLTGNDTDTSEVTCNYADPRTTLTIAQASVYKTSVDAGIPITTQLRMSGWRESEIQQMLDDRIAETPVDMDEARLQQVYDLMAERNAKMIEPMVGEALNLISQAVTDQIIASGVVAKAAAATTATA